MAKKAVSPRVRVFLNKQLYAVDTCSLQQESLIFLTRSQIRNGRQPTLHSAALVTFCGLVGCAGGSVAAGIALAFGLRQGRPVLRADVTVTFSYT